MSFDALKLELGIIFRENGVLTLLEAIIPPLPVTERGKTTILGSDNNGENVVYAHGKSIYLRNLLVNNLGPISNQS